jgi:hypothetical protein
LLVSTFQHRECIKNSSGIMSNQKLQPIPPGFTETKDLPEA